ncbi:DUF3572 family protein [bacterium]|nr:MAG: DUF3572 family protein [bacterium]
MHPAPRKLSQMSNIGVRTLRYIASKDSLLKHFVDTTGFNAGHLKTEEDADPEFFVAVLDFILASGMDTIELAAHLHVAVGEIVAARNAWAKKAGIDLAESLTE